MRPHCLGPNLVRPRSGAFCPVAAFLLAAMSPRAFRADRAGGSDNTESRLSPHAAGNTTNPVQVFVMSELCGKAFPSAEWLADPQHTHVGKLDKRNRLGEVAAILPQEPLPLRAVHRKPIFPAG